MGTIDTRYTAHCFVKPTNRLGFKDGKLYQLYEIMKDYSLSYEWRLVGIIDAMHPIANEALTTIKQAELVGALKPFARYACDEPHINEQECYNCRARRVIERAEGKHD